MSENILLIEATQDVPEIYCNAQDGIVKITGCSTSPHVPAFGALLDWLAIYVQNPTSRTEIEVRLENPSGETLGFFYCDLFKILRDMYRAKHDVLLVWHYDKTSRGHARLLLDKAQEDDDPGCHVLFHCNFSYEQLFGFPLVFRKLKRTQETDIDDLCVEGTATTPLIRCRKYEDRILIEIKGCSAPDDHHALYQPLFDWLRAYEDSELPVCVNLQLDYFNDSSSAYLHSFLERLIEMWENGAEVSINWYYEEDNEDIFEQGEDLSSWIKIPFNMIVVE
jgi:hypothetical protein